uniref:Uncharacterized protein n=1 Tax=Romanomermis culicivorax TaxID=13658 RepID=A0A915I467_ROMCU
FLDYPIRRFKPRSSPFLYLQAAFFRKAFKPKPVRYCKSRPRFCIVVLTSQAAVDHPSMYSSYKNRGYHRASSQFLERKELPRPGRRISREAGVR